MNRFRPQKLSKSNTMEASAIASVEENNCHESLCESFRHVVDVLFKSYIPLTLTPTQ